MSGGTYSTITWSGPTSPLRHAGAYLGRNGSGFETRLAVVTVYERRR
jgi:hypothetical protein